MLANNVKLKKVWAKSLGFGVPQEDDFGLETAWIVVFSRFLHAVIWQFLPKLQLLLKYIKGLSFRGLTVVF